MSVTREALLEKVLIGYSRSYDIERVQESSCPELAACAQFHVSEAQYVISKKAQMWSTQSHEYVYFFSVPKLTGEICSRCIQYAYDDGMPRIDVEAQSNHMCTRLTAVFLCDEADAEAVKAVKSCRIYKSFQFSLKGWMEFHTALADLGKESVVSNSYGRETAKFLKTLLNPSPGSKGKRTLGILKKMLN